MKKKLLCMTLALILSLSIFAVGCSSSKNGAAKEKESAKQQTDFEKIKKSGKIVLGTCADYPPYEFHKVTNGKDEITGFDILILKEAAKDLGVELEIKDMSFDGLLSALQAGTVDVVAAGMNPTPERMKSVDFSNNYDKIVQSLIVRTEDKDKYKTIDDFKGKKVAAQKGSTQQDFIKEKMPGSEFKGLSKVTDIVLDLKNKKVEAAVLEEPIAKAYVSKNPDLAISDVDVKGNENGYAIAIKKDNKELLDSINKTLDRLTKDGSINKFMEEMVKEEAE